MVMELIHLEARPRARYAFVESDAAVVQLWGARHQFNCRYSPAPRITLNAAS
jgi:hypothetical protein